MSTALWAWWPPCSGLRRGRRSGASAAIDPVRTGLPVESAGADFPGHPVRLRLPVRGGGRGPRALAGGVWDSPSGAGDGRRGGHAAGPHDAGGVQHRRAFGEPLPHLAALYRGALFQVVLPAHGAECGYRLGLCGGRAEHRRGHRLCFRGRHGGAGGVDGAASRDAAGVLRLVVVPAGAAAHGGHAVGRSAQRSSHVFPLRRTLAGGFLEPAVGLCTRPSRGTARMGAGGRGGCWVAAAGGRRRRAYPQHRLAQRGIAVARCHPEEPAQRARPDEQSPAQRASA